MSITVPQINTAAGGDTFSILYTRFNLIANALSTQIITTAANTVGAPTTGNAIVSGIFSATVLATPTLRGGNCATATDLIITGNTIHNSGSISVGNSTINTSINATAIVVNNATIQNLTVASLSLGSSVVIGSYTDAYLTYTTSNTSNQVVDSFLFATQRSAEYFLQVKDSAGSNYQVSKLLVITDGLDAYMTEYAQIVTNNQVGVFTAAINSTACQLLFQGNAAVNTIKMSRKAMAI